VPNLFPRAWSDACHNAVALMEFKTGVSPHLTFLGVFVMSLHESQRSGQSELSQLVVEKSELEGQKGQLAQELVSETAALRSLSDFMRRLKSRLELLEKKLAAINRLKFQADSVAQYHSGSMDADFLVDELAATINSLKTMLGQVKLKFTDTSCVRDEHMRVFLDVEKRLSEISESIKEICGESSP
jgi:hypothetical protein